MSTLNRDVKSQPLRVLLSCDTVVYDTHQSEYISLAKRASGISLWNCAVPLGTAPRGCRRTGMRSFQATYSRTPVASHFAITGWAEGVLGLRVLFPRRMVPQERLLRGKCNLGHHQLARDNGGRDRVKGSQFRFPRSLSLHERRDCYDRAALLITRQRMKSASVSRPPVARLVSASHRMRMLRSAATAAVHPATTKMVQSCSPSAPRMTNLAAFCRSLTRSLMEPRPGASG